MQRHLAYVSLLIDDYDNALEYFTQVLGFEVVQDEQLTNEKRWIVVAPSAEGGALLLAKASTAEQRELQVELKRKPSSLVEYEALLKREQFAGANAES